MKLLLTVATLLVARQVAAGYNVTCFYDTSSIMRVGNANFTGSALQTSVELCTHIVYGYVGIRPGTFDVVPLDKRQLPVLQQVRDLKKKHRNVKFLLGLGGDQDHNQPEKYMQLLESGSGTQQTFVKSVHEFVRKYQFDGLDLSIPLPRNKPFKKKSKINETVKKATKAATDKVKKNLGLKNAKSSKKATKHKVHAHKQQLTQLIGELRTAFIPSRLMLTLTVLPNVNSSQYFNVPAIMSKLDFVNLASFDYSTPIRNPHQADYLAPLYAPPLNKARNAKANVDEDVRYWTKQRANPKQLNVGIAAYGRTWKIKKTLKSSSLPIVSALDGAAPGDAVARTTGLMSWPEICTNVQRMTKFEDKQYGSYAYNPVAVKGSEGLLVTYDNVTSIAEKASYVKKRGLGGMALFDLSLDDFHGKCNGEKFPLLKSIRYKLL